MSRLEEARDHLDYGWREVGRGWASAREVWRDKQAQEFDRLTIQPLTDQLVRTLDVLDELIAAVEAARRELR